MKYTIILFLLGLTLLANNLQNGFSPPINIWNINSNSDDFAPYFVESKGYVIFNSIVNDYSKYFITNIEEKDSNIVFKNPIILNSGLNQNKKNTAYFCLLNDKQALVNAHNQYNNGNYVNIKKTNYERNTWTAPNNIPELSESDFIGHPAISPSKNTLVFSTNKNTSDLNLYQATLRNDGVFDMFIMLDELNSIGNEITPCFVNDTTLIFASDGFDGKGGYDLYYSYYIEGRWTKPLPLEDLNTEYNESDPAILLDGIVFASDRPGGKGGLDLYYSQIKSNEVQEDIKISISATNYQLNITQNIEYDLVADKIKNRINADTTYILTPSAIEFNIIKSNPTFNNISYKLYCESDILENNTINNSDSSVIIRFAKYAPKIFMFDSCYFQVLYTQTAPITIPLEIIKSENKSIKIHSENNNTFYRVLAVFANNIKEFEDFNKDIISNLKELASYSNKIDIIANSKKTYSELSKIFNSKQNITFIEKIDADIIEFRVYK